MIAGFCALCINRMRLRRCAIVLKPSTLLAVLGVAEKSEPGRIATMRQPVVNAQDSPNNIRIDFDAERPCDLLSDSRTTPGGMASLHFYDGLDQFLPSGRGAIRAWEKTAADPSASSRACGGELVELRFIPV